MANQVQKSPALSSLSVPESSPKAISTCPVLQVRRPELNLLSKVANSKKYMTGSQLLQRFRPEVRVNEKRNGTVSPRGCSRCSPASTATILEQVPSNRGIIIRSWAISINRPFSHLSWSSPSLAERLRPSTSFQPRSAALPLQPSMQLLIRAQRPSRSFL